ncbi:MAG: hypothetical protein IJM33_04990 [Bacteroidales bacterium]|nr:hypothetical protein [Bacteroidales bacterium]
MKKLLFLATILVAFASLADAQIIGSTNSATSPRSPKVDNSPLYRPTGGYIRFSGGFPTLLSVAYNYQLNPSFMLGGGVGVGFGREMRKYWKSDELVEQSLENGDPSFIPIYAEAEFRTPKYRWSLFFNIKVGYSLFKPEDKVWLNYYGYTKYQYHYSPWLVAVAVGASYKNLHFGGGMSNVCALDADGPTPNVFLAYSLPFSGIKRALF